METFNAVLAFANEYPVITNAMGFMVLASTVVAIVRHEVKRDDSRKSRTQA